MLHPGAMAEIPELEFEIGADHKRRVDSIYNHIGGAIFNLERHVEMLGEDGEQASRERQGIMDVCDELRKVLDMEGEIGRLAEGYSADIIAVDGNPLEDVSVLENVDFVMVRGRVIE